MSSLNEFFLSSIHLFPQFGYFVLCPRSGRHRLLRCRLFLCRLPRVILIEAAQRSVQSICQSIKQSLNQSENLCLPYCQKLVNFTWKTLESNRIWIKYLIVYKNVLIFYCPFVTFWSFCNILKTLICFYRCLRDTMH